MTAWPRLSLISFTFIAVLGLLPVGDMPMAWAQLGPTQLPQAGEPMPTKTEGVAEQAPEGPSQLPTTPVLPQTKNTRKRFELIELDGYYRFRTDWFKNFNLGFTSYGPGGAPFPQPLGCRKVDVGGDGEVTIQGPCQETLKGANMRLRLEPTINVSETTRVHLQVDLLDNLVMGSTPDSLAGVSLGAFSGSQEPPQPDKNGLDNAIRVRRAWAEVETSLGQLTVGRQPWHWGLGIYANGGGFDPFSGTYDMDNEYGDTVDRAMFRAGIPGTNLDAALATDWAVTYPSAAQDGLSGGQAWDQEDKDDVSQWVFMITRYDRPDIFADAVARGDVAINYGGFLAYRTQDWATRPPAAGEEFTDTLVQRGLKSYTPDGWLKLARGNVLVELEAVASIGSIDNVSDIELPRYPVDPANPDATETVAGSVDIRRFGAVARARYRAMQDKLHIGFEVGYASGDQWDNTNQGEVHVRNARPLPIGNGDTAIENFYFNPGYRIDRILFRQLVGTVTNATYFKPSGSYRFTDEITFQAQGIFSVANKSAATPGDGSTYGLELDGDLSYRSGPVSAGIVYGIYLPMSAMHHPADEVSGLGYGNNSGDAGTAQLIQSRLMIQF